MSLTDITATIRAAAESEETRFRAFIDEHLPALETAATDAERVLSSPVTQALTAATHIPAAPEIEQWLADGIRTVEGALERLAQQIPPAEPPAEPAPAE